MDKIHCFFLLSIRLSWLAVMAASNITTDQLALLTLRDHIITSEPYHILANNWSITSSVCDWVGVTCGSRHRRVTVLNISNMNLTGTLPPQLGNLSFLISLNISINNFYGELPPDLARLRRLRYLKLDANNLGGKLPSWFGYLQKLQYLSLANNSFTGFIPTSISNMSNLETLQLSFNSIEGSIPMEFPNLHNLKNLIIENNQLSGSLPLHIFNISSMEIISLLSNSLSGNLPGNICHGLTKLTWLGLSANNLAGHIPSTFSQCSLLQILSLSVNYFTGSIPREMGNLTRLEGLYLGANNLKGAIPDEIWNLTMLTTLDFGDNFLTGILDSGPSIEERSSVLQAIWTVKVSHNNKMTPIFKAFLMSRSHRTRVCQPKREPVSKLFTMQIKQSIHLNEGLGPGVKRSPFANTNAIYNIAGVIPEKVGNLQGLEVLYLFNNTLWGSIPVEIFNISALQDIGLESNNFSGTLPSTVGDKLSNLELLRLQHNDLSGVIPNSISNASKLEWITFQFNGFAGSIPSSLGNSRNLEMLNLANNNLSTESSSSELSFLTYLTSCRSLRYLIVGDNPFDAYLPTSISNYSASLEILAAGTCKIKGNIPDKISNLSSLLMLDMSDNELTGSVPRTIQGLTILQRLDLRVNEIREPLDVFCELNRLGELQLSQNQFSGPLPKCLANLTYVSKIYLGSNKLTSKIPASLWSMKNLQVLNLSSNFLTGPLPPEIGNLKAAYLLDLSINQLSDTIPTTIGDLQDLTYLSLAKNTLQGSIPDSIGGIKSLESLNLSHNNLSGSIPKSLEVLRFLKEFNVSFNRLSGEIPKDGPFRSFTSESFMYNEALCGNYRFNVPPCAGSSRKTNLLPKVLTFSGIAILLMAVIVAVLVLRCRAKQEVPGEIQLLNVPTYGRFPYYDLLRSTNHFSESNLLGIGSFGSVYRGVLNDGGSVAIKVFNLHLEGAFKSFDRECEVLRNLRHRNLTKVMGNCSNLDFKALVLQYMPNGNLEKWLYSHNHFLDIIQRVNIMIDVASALEYLHFGYQIPVVHCDLKPSNILLDEDMVAHVNDFGIAKMFGEGESVLHTNTLATLGYIAPEYGSEGLVSTSIDVYSFGIILMETFSRMKPSDEMFLGALSLKSWVEDSLPNVLQVIDANLVRPEDAHMSDKLEFVMLIMKLALNCCTEHPRERISMKGVLAELKKLKHRFLMRVTS